MMVKIKTAKQFCAANNLSEAAPMPLSEVSECEGL
jgi:hypothetical protein